MMSTHAGDSGAGEWLLSAAQRGNPATHIDRGRPGEAAWSHGNRVHPLIHGAPYFRRLLAELRDCEAGDQVYFVAWRGDPAQRLDGPGTAVAVELARAISAGVRVYGLIWRSHLDWVNKQARDNRDFVKMLQVLGGSVVLDQRVRSAGSHHQKFVVIRRPNRPDTDVAFVGGIDLSYARRDDAEHHGDPLPPLSMAAVYGDIPAWHDAHLEIHGPAVADVEYCFRERWDDPVALQHLPWIWVYDRVRTHRHGKIPLPATLPAPPHCGPHAVQLLRTYPNKMLSYPFAPSGEYSVARGYAKALRQARHLVYIEDQFLWSPLVAGVFAEALRANPGLRLVAVVPHAPVEDGKVHVAANNLAQRQAVRVLAAAGAERVQIYELENPLGSPVYVHAKVCVIDDVWAAVGSANINRRSWTHDSELTAAVLDETPAGEDEPARAFARDLRLRLWREHLDRADGDDADLLDPDRGVAALRETAAELDAWHAAGRRGARPAGRLRSHALPQVTRAARWWAPPAIRALFDPDGRSLHAQTRSRRRGV